MATSEANMNKIIKPIIKYLKEFKCHPITTGMVYRGYHTNCLRPYVPHIFRLSNTNLNEIDRHLLYTWLACKEKIASSLGVKM